jgi:excisionase family DNA binding protein
MSVTPLPRWSTIPDAARQLGVSPWTIRKEIHEGRLRARRVGRLVRVLDDDLAAWMRGEFLIRSPLSETPLLRPRLLGEAGVS